MPTEGKRRGATAQRMLEVYSAGDMQSEAYECGIWVPLESTKSSAEDDSANTVATMTVLGMF